MADNDGGNKRSGGGAFMVALLLVALIGVGGGTAFSMLVMNDISRSPPAASEQTAAHADTKGAAHDTKNSAKGSSGSPPGRTLISTLDPIYVTLTGVDRTTLRLDAAIVFEGDDDTNRAALTAVIGQDFALYLKGLSTEQLDTTAGLEFVREDLNEIVQLRAGKLAREVVLKAIMIE
ncbi:MAG: flagellar basal body-associated FliL family protein [Hyphomicrobiaceae bacterium]|nr:flagellar basal body-associated FliL family protein [Hyphomicrobiaceae bacterium]